MRCYRRSLLLRAGTCSIAFHLLLLWNATIQITAQAAAAAGGGACQTDLDCNLNGICAHHHHHHHHRGSVNGVNGANNPGPDGGSHGGGKTCHCDPAWTGPSCGRLNLLPTSIRSGYRPQNRSSWGGSVVHQGGLYHMFAAEMVEECGLTSWQTNSRTIHATSETLVGPYIFQRETISVWSHNPTVVRASEGTYMLLSAGYGGSSSDAAANHGSGMSPPMRCGPSGCCRNGKSPCGMHIDHPCNATSGSWPRPDPDPEARNPLGAYRNFTAYVTKAAPDNDVMGPWILKTLKTDQNTHQYTPAGVAFPNGTVVVLLVGGGLFRSDTWDGPYERWGTDMYWGCGGEDPFLYIDRRGNWHCIYHAGPYDNLTVAGGHSFSMDGLTWHTTPEATYRGDVLEEILDDGSVQLTRIAKRERPHLVFDGGGHIVALTTGICYGTNWGLCNNNPWKGYYDKTFTHVQLVAGHPEAAAAASVE